MSIEEIDDAVEVEVKTGEDPKVEDATEKDVKDAKSEGARAGDDEREAYGEKVQKRISELTRKRGDEERLRKQAESERQEAVEYAKAAHEENKRLAAELKAAREDFRTTSTKDLDSAIESTRMAYQKALEEGDSAGAAKLMDESAALRARKAMLENQKEPEEKEIAPPPEPKRAPAAAVPQKEPSEKTKAWVAKNKWFRQDRVLTATAMGFHDQAINEEGITPESDEYFDFIDRNMRATFPKKFESDSSDSQGEGARGRTSVAPAGRSSPRTQRVKLTASERNIARELGITEEQYAAEKLRMRGTA